MKQLVTLASLFISISTFSQSNFVVGSISKLNGQSLKGLIDYREWDINPRSIQFKDLSQHIVEYKCADLLEFRIDEKNEIYKRANVSVNYEIPPVYQTAQKIDYHLKLTRDTVFLLKLADGIINLYYLKDDKSSQHFFIQKNNGRIEELIQRTIFVGNTSELNSTTSSHYYQSVYFDDYKKQLEELMSDYPPIEQEVRNLILNYSSTLDLVKKYNAFKRQLTYVKPKDKGTSAIYAFSGLAQSFFVADDYFYNNLDRVTTNSTSATIGVGFEWSIIRSNKKLFVGIETAYQQNKVAYSAEIRHVKNDYNIDVRGFRYNAYLKYILYKGAIVQPYMKGGIYLASYFKRSSLSTDEITRPVSTNPNNLLKSEQFVFAALGFKMRSFFVETRYEVGTDINKITGQNLKIHRLSLLGGYSFQFGKEKNKR